MISHIRSTIVSSAVALLLSVATNNIIVDNTVDAFPFGAGGCSGGQPAVGGGHLMSAPAGLNLLAAGFPLAINGITPNGGTPIELTVGETHSITVTANGGTPFRGILMRSESVVGNVVEMATTQSPDLSASGACTCDPSFLDCEGTVVGITHTDRNDKTTATATLTSDTPGPVTLDVTIVVALVPAMEISTYYYEGFPIMFVEPTPETDAPVTSAPVTAAPVTSAPVTAAPVAAPVSAAPVTAAPITSAPVTSAPVTAAPVTMAPVTAAPVTEAPVEVPDMMDSDVPSDMPSMVPSSGPTAAASMPFDLSTPPTPTTSMPVSDPPTTTSPPSSATTNVVMTTTMSYLVALCIGVVFMSL